MTDNIGPTTTTRVRLTPHQRDVWNWYRKLRLPAPAHYAPGAVWKLAAKGYVSVEERHGPRGGRHLYVTEVHHV